MYDREAVSWFITCSYTVFVQLCLESLNAIICYSTLPSSALSIVTITLCHTLNISALSKPSLEVTEPFIITECYVVTESGYIFLDDDTTLGYTCWHGNPIYTVYNTAR